ncbi:MAG: hypothetical protein CMM23_09725 [Rhodospirillaceae bacterium]|jgi:hypothetical protein|nr:hypothetical protein [Rhodospirillaceae bacterium]|tara:strand:+ start:7359 stop:7556 length:198 start_codon:yes stop_codon:yes gene_type:complete
MTCGAASGRLLADLMEGYDSVLLSAILDIPQARRLPSRPFHDLSAQEEDWYEEKSRLNAFFSTNV